MDHKQLAGVELDEYSLVEIVGAGGMSAVYRTYQEELDRYVAVKVLSSQLASDTSYIARFNQEAKMAASLEHPHIVPVYDFGIHKEMMYVVMRLLTGGTLRDKMQGSPMNKHEVMHTLKAMAQALDYAHGRNIVHRDVKPGNIMFDTQGIPYLVDFGIAKATQQQDVELTANNMVMGTPVYMPPEQWRGEQPVPATDQYALAVIAYEMLTGYPAFAGTSSQNLMYQHINDMPKLTHHVNPELPTQVSDVLQHALSKNAADRYPHISNFANALGQAIQQPVARETIQSRAHETVEHRAVETVARQVAPQPASQPPPQKRPSPPPQPASNNNNMTSMLSGGIVGMILLTLVVLGGGFIFMQFTNRDDNTIATSQPEDTTGNDNEIIDVPTLTPLPAPEIDVVGLSNFPLSQRAILSNEPTIPVRDAIYSPDGQIIVSAHGDGTIRFWRGGNVSTHPAHTDVASALAFSPNGQYLASVGRDNNVKIWRVSDMQNIQTLTGHSAALRDVEFSPDGQRLATASEDLTIGIWRVSDWSLETMLRKHENRVLGLAWSPDSTLLASGGQEARIYLWDMMALRFNRYLDGHEESVRDVDFSPDGRKLVSSSTDNSLKIWDLESSRTLQTMDGHGRDVWTVIFSPDGASIASGGRDNTLRIWDTATGSQLENITSHAGWVLGIDFAPDGSAIVSASGDGTVRIWE
jgi:eukaryotic-like serine/threonine-protein kinase